MDRSTPGFPVLHYLPEFVCSDSCPLSQWCHSTISSSVAPFSFWPSIFPHIRVFSSELALCIRWPKYWSFSFSISPSNEYSGLISFRIHQFDLLVIQGILKSLLQCHSLKASILRCSAFFTIHLSHLYMITGKTRALTIWTFVSKMRSLLLKTLFSINKCYAPPYPLCHQTSEFQNKLQTKEFWSGLYAFLQWVISMLEMS